MNRQYKAFVCFDLGDTIMMEETEEKDETETTQRADLIPGLATILRGLHADHVLLGLIADTMIGTYRNVLKQHDLYDLFDVFSISDELGVAKPHRLMFDHARELAVGCGFSDDRALMVGNHYYRDIEGGRDAGFDTCWFHWNDRFAEDRSPKDSSAPAADGVVTTAEELDIWIRRWIDKHAVARRSETI